MKFSEGAGSSEVVAELVRDRISPLEFNRHNEVAKGLVLRSPAELHYYRIWREVMASHIPPSCVGRTLDRTAAAGRSGTAARTGTLSSRGSGASRGGGPRTERLL